MTCHESPGFCCPHEFPDGTVEKIPKPLYGKVHFHHGSPSSERVGTHIWCPLWHPVPMSAGSDGGAGRQCGQRASPSFRDCMTQPPLVYLPGILGSHLSSREVVLGSRDFLHHLASLFCAVSPNLEPSLHVSLHHHPRILESHLSHWYAPAANAFAPPPLPFLPTCLHPS